MSAHELWNELGNLYFLIGTYDQAIHAYNKAITLSPEAGEPYSNLALTYVQMGKYPEASEFYQRGIHCLTDELDKAVSMHKLGDVYLHLKQYTEAMETYQRMEELVPDLGPIVESSKPADLLLHCQIPDAMPQQSGMTEIRDLISVPSKQSPMLIEELTPWWFENQIAPPDDPQPDSDFEFFVEATYTDSNENIVFTEPLTWHLGANDSRGTADLFSRDEEAVNAESTSGNGEAADESPESKPAHAPIMVIIDDAEIVTEQPGFDAQDMTAPEAVQYETPLEWPIVELSDEERQEIQVNINKFKRVLELNPRNAFAWDTLGGYYKALSQYDDAIHAYQQAVHLDPTKAFYFHHLGLVFAAAGRHEEAIDAFERVIEVDPDHSLAHATLGGYYRKNGNEELAQKHIEQARSLLAEDENEYNRACMEAICGNTDRSLELLELALKDKQSYVNWARKDPDLDFVRSDPRFHALLSEYAARPV